MLSIQNLINAFQNVHISSKDICEHDCVPEISATSKSHARSQNQRAYTLRVERDPQQTLSSKNNATKRRCMPTNQEERAKRSVHKKHPGIQLLNHNWKPYSKQHGGQKQATKKCITDVMKHLGVDDYRK